MIFKIIIAGIFVCLINIFLKKQMSEFVLPTEIIFLAISAGLIIDFLKNSTDNLFGIIGSMEYGDEILASAVKGAGICLITKISCDICAESGNRLVADIIDLSGRVMLAVIALPYFEAIIKIAFEFVK